MDTRDIVDVTTLAHHTEGEWFNNGGRICAKQDDYHTATYICDVGTISKQTPENTANACLICAAPLGPKLAEAVLNQAGDGLDRTDLILDLARQIMDHV